MPSKISGSRHRITEGQAMDTQSLRETVKQVISNYARLTPSHGTIRLDTVFDEVSDRYALMQTGWSQRQRVRGNLIYITIQSNQIHIEYDGIEHGLTQDLTDRGVPTHQIIHAFLTEPQAELAATLA
jgi:plasmid maintenance system antidote protein VapI